MYNVKNKIIGIVCATITALLLFTASSCFVLVNDHISGNGIVKTKTVLRSDFDAVSVSGDWTVNIRYSETFSVTIEADENLFNYLYVYVLDNTLHIGFHRGYAIDRTHCKAFITMPVLKQLTASGALTGTITSFTMYRETMSIVISGAGDVTARDISVKNLQLKISGAGSFTAIGEAQKMTAVISGSGDIKTIGLETENADIAISGSGSARVWVTKSLIADISGTGSIRYKGNPVIIPKISGFGSIVPL